MKRDLLRKFDELNHENDRLRGTISKLKLTLSEEKRETEIVCLEETLESLTYFVQNIAHKDNPTSEEILAMVTVASLIFNRRDDRHNCLN